MAEPELGEVWRRVEGHPDYEVSSLGRVRRATRGYGTRPGRLLKLRPAGTGYLRVHLGKANPWTTVHTVVLEAFHGPRPIGQESRHLNGDRQDNRADNLRWGTRKENEADKLRHGTHLCGERNPKAKFSAAEVSEIRRAYAEVMVGRNRYVPRGWLAGLAAKHGVLKGTVRMLIRQRTWR